MRQFYIWATLVILDRSSIRNKHKIQARNNIFSWSNHTLINFIHAIDKDGGENIGWCIILLQFIYLVDLMLLVLYASIVEILVRTLTYAK